MSFCSTTLEGVCSLARSLGNVIADSMHMSLGYAERLLAGVTAEQFGRFARPGGHVVESNHGAFIYGHLSTYGPRIVTQLGGDVSKLVVPDNFTTLFSKEAKCVDDPDGTIYPPMAEITRTFFNGYRAAMEALRAASDESLQQPNLATGRMAELLPTLGSIQNFYTGGHMMMHLGQMSAWRRMMGLGAA